jgi:hypothetical protein
MHPRLAEEWPDILATYPDASHRIAPERVEMTLELDANTYGLPNARIAVLVPAGYRVTGPDGFLVPNALTMRGGGSLPASDAAGIGMPGWLLLSFHMIDSNGQTTWRPTADPHRGDNIIGYVASIEAFLARGCN